MNNNTALLAFLNDIDCLKPVTDHLDRINIFRVLGIENTEIRHSFMLAWLMDPEANHGLGDSVLHRILQYADSNAPKNCCGFTVSREQNNIDLMAVSESDRYVLCIENKIYSAEHDNQLSRYKEHIDNVYPEYKKSLIYLTPTGKPSSDPKNWISMSYQDILDIISDLAETHHLAPEAALLIRNYMEVIGRYNRKDSDIRKICEEIYSRHREALDLIFDSNSEHHEGEGDQNSISPEEKKTCNEIYLKYKKEMKIIRLCRPRKGGDTIADYIIAWASEKTDEERIRLDPDNTSEATIRFTTKAMSSLLPDVPGSSSAWGTENFYFYEIRNVALERNDPNSDRCMRIELSVNYGDAPEYLRSICDRINKFSPATGKGKHFRLNFVTQNVVFSVKDSREKVQTQLENCLDNVENFEQELIAYLSKA